MKKQSLVGMMAVIVIGLSTMAVKAEPGAVASSGLFYRVTSPVSTNNDAAIAGIMELTIRRGENPGYIPRDFATNPKAVEKLLLARGCQLIFSTDTNLVFWDSVTNVAPGFAGEHGSRYGYAGDHSQTNQFYVINCWFQIGSSDGANTIRYPNAGMGNLGVDATTGATLTFSPTLRGELWDSNGNVIATYYNGEDLASHPVNRVTFLIRVGYKITAYSQITSGMTYFQYVMPLTNSFMFGLPDWGVTNSITSRPVPIPVAVPDSGGNANIYVLGQRRISGLTFGLRQSPDVGTNAVWTIVAGRKNDWEYYTSSGVPKMFFKAFEEWHPGSALVHQSAKTELPVLVIDNGPEGSTKLMDEMTVRLYGKKK
jgi:hypothetical protein